MQESIFHKIVRNEPSHTQLLCNFLKRDEAFRRRVLTLFLRDESLASRIQPGNIATEFIVPECGRPDVVIQTDEMCVVVEVKLNPRRGLTAHQEPSCGEDDLRRYVDFLRDAREQQGKQTWLIFLVPVGWHYKEQAEEDLRSLEKSHKIRTRLVLWDDLLAVVKKIESPDRQLLEEFSKLLSERVGPVSFSIEEVEMLFSENFSASARAVWKLDTIILEVEKLAKKHNQGRYAIDATSKKEKLAEDGNAIYFKSPNRKELFFYFGCWADFWEDKQAPLCFGIEKNAAPRIEKAFSSCN